MKVTITNSPLTDLERELLEACRRLLAQWDHKTQRDPQHLGPFIADIRKIVEEPTHVQ